MDRVRIIIAAGKISSRIICLLLDVGKHIKVHINGICTHVCIYTLLLLQCDLLAQNFQAHIECTSEVTAS